MKGVALRLTILFTFLALAVPWTLAESPPVNLVRNPSFTLLDESGFAQDWSVVPREGTVEFLIDTETYRSEGSSLLIRSGTESTVPARGNVTQRFPLTEGEIIAISAWYKGTVEPGAVQMKIVTVDTEEGFSRFPLLFEDLDTTRYDQTYGRWRISNDGDLYVTATSIDPNEWKELRAYIVRPPEVKQLHVELFLWRSFGSVWWDDIHVSVFTP